VSPASSARLKLKVNEAKSAVARPQERKFLGFSFTGGRAETAHRAKALLRCKQRVRELTRRTRGISLEQMTKELASYLRGWKSYFGFCQTPSVLQGSGSMDTAQAAIRDLEAMEAGQVRFREAAPTEHRHLTWRLKPPAVPMVHGA
jgi:RNA-directed DNA polymerase